ncbi:MAG: porin [bacterium]
MKVLIMTGFSLIACCCIAPGVLFAQATAPTDTTPKITFGGFVDGYYAYDFNRPPTLDRSFTTQPARHNEFNVNLAYVEAKLDAPHYRGRFAIQTGTSVQSNYAGEPRNGSVSGPDLSRLIQEAVVGVKIADNLWVDGGIFLSHIGMESFISRDNPIYTRSLVADYSPYYESGAKLTWTPTPTVAAQLDVVNGWQIISESNASKSAGIRVDVTPSATATYSYFNYLGDEAPDSATRHQIRFYNGVGAKVNLTPAFQVMAEADYGTQQRATGSSASWYGGMLVGRYQMTATAALISRIEAYEDRDQVIVVTGLPDGLRSTGASIGIDVAPAPRVVWRSELRGYQGQHAVFPMNAGGFSKNDAFVVTSLGLTF